MTVEITVRRAVPEDYSLIGMLLGGLLDMHRCKRPDLFEESAARTGKYTEKEYLDLLNDGRAVIFTACRGEKAVGYLVCKIVTGCENPVLKNVKTLYLDDLCVAEDERRRGAGRALMSAAESYARENGFYNLTLNVWEFNENAREFYEHLGYNTQRREMEKIL